MAEKPKRIIMPFGGNTEVAHLMGCSRPTVIKALNGTYDTHNEKENALAVRIRQCALNHGGAIQD